MISAANTSVVPTSTVVIGTANLNQRLQGAVERDVALSTIKPVGSAENMQKLTVDARATVPTSREIREEVSRENAAQEKAQQRQQFQQDQIEIRDLSARDREVRAHEQAHAAVGGQYAGAPSYQFERGPNGVSYAVSGEVPIDTGKEATPEQTIVKSQIVRRAALAPADPSPQDRSVAAAALRVELQARAELVVENAQEARASADGEVTNQDAPNAVAALTEGDAASDDRSSDGDGDDASRANGTNYDAGEISSRAAATVGLLSQSIANTVANPINPGQLLNQIV